MNQDLNTSLRLFTQSPYPEFAYIITPKEYPFCANQSLFSFIKGINYHFKWVEVFPAQVLDFVYVQTCILKFNNTNNKDSHQFLATLEKIFKWGSEDPYDKIAYETVVEVVEAVLWADNYLDILEDKGYEHVIYNKSLWYADHIMKPVRYQDETWKEYTTRIKSLKVEARTKFKNREAKAVIEEKSRELKALDMGVTPTPKTLEAETPYDCRKIKSVTEKGVVWQSNTDYNRTKYLKIKHMYPKLTQEEIANYLNISSRTIRRLVKTC